MALDSYPIISKNSAISRAIPRANVVILILFLFNAKSFLLRYGSMRFSSNGTAKTMADFAPGKAYSKSVDSGPPSRVF